MASKIKSIPPWLLYGLYFLAVTVFFLYQLFPAEAMKRHVQGLASRLDPSLQTIVGQVKPAFPAHVVLSNISLLYNRQLLFKAEQATVAPRFFSLLAGRKGYTLRSRVYDGSVTARLETVSEIVAGQLQASGLDLAKIPALKRLEGIRPAGWLDMRLDFLPEDGTFTAGGTFHIKDFEVNLAEVIPGMTVFSFSSIDGKIRCRANQLTIAEGKARGQQADVGIRGTLTAEKPFPQSELDLFLTVRPHATLIAALRKNPALQWVSAGMAGKTGLPIRIHGTIEDPQISVQ